MDKKLPEKIYQYLLHFYDAPDTSFIHDFVVHCDMYTSPDYGSSFSGAQRLFVIVHPDVYKKHSSILKNLEKIIWNKLEEISDICITAIKIYPDLNKFQILKNNYTPIVTPWEEINNGQNHLIDLLRTAKETVDFQNIGNTSRTLLQNISNIVFDKARHVSDIPNIDLSEGKFKNRLHTYIKCEMGGQENKEIRDFAISVITTAEKAIDLANKLTHDLKANSMLGESCVISTIAAVSIVRLIRK